jgi:hypothetical protein
LRIHFIILAVSYWYSTLASALYHQLYAISTTVEAVSSLHFQLLKLLLALVKRIHFQKQSMWPQNPEVPSTHLCRAKSISLLEPFVKAIELKGNFRQFFFRLLSQSFKKSDTSREHVNYFRAVNTLGHSIQ